MDQETPHHHQQQNQRQSHQPNLKLIESFWEWFYVNQNEFGEKFDNLSLSEELDFWVRRLGPYAWEFGPGKSKGKFLQSHRELSLNFWHKQKKLYHMLLSLMGGRFITQSHPRAGL
jgi:hypothetical protein